MIILGLFMYGGFVPIIHEEPRFVNKVYQFTWRLIIQQVGLVGSHIEKEVINRWGKHQQTPNMGKTW